MKCETVISGVNVKVTTDDEIEMSGFFGEVYCDRKSAPALIEFIQQWLDHDPEQELIEKLTKMSPIYPSQAREIIAAVREHDAKYGSA